MGTTSTVDVDKPTGAVVRKAFAAAASTGFGGHQIVDGDVALNGRPIVWDPQRTMENSIGSYNAWAEVTSLVKPQLDASPPGRIGVPVSEGSYSSYIDGVILAVIFDHPASTTDSTVILAYGAQQVSGDTITLNRATSSLAPVVTLGLGISFGYQPTDQYSTVAVNGTVITSSAGGHDDGQSANGALITVGGLRDTPSNPPDALSTGWAPGCPRCDDELYDLSGFAGSSSTSTLELTTANPSADDNLFFGALFVEGGSASWTPGGTCTDNPPVLSSLASEVLSTIQSPGSLQNSPVPVELLLSSCNSLERILVDGPQIFGGIEDAIASARHEVVMAFYAWEPSSVAVTRIGDGLRRAQAAHSGPERLLVRLVVSDQALPGTGRTIDGLYDSQKEWKDKWEFDDNKIELQLATYPYKAFGSLHDKYVVVDGATVVITGANPQAHHDPGTPWHDTGYVLHGEVGRSLLASFDGTWNQAKHWTCRQQRLQRDCEETDHPDRHRSWLSDLRPSSGETSVIAVGRNARELRNNDTDNPQDLAWLEVMNRAADNIQILSPNVNDDAFQQAVLDAAGRGVEVRLIASKKFNDIVERPFGGNNDHVFRSLRERMRAEHPDQDHKLKLCWYSRDGVEPVEGKKAASHAKFLSVDGQLAIVGSGNMDTQSWNQSHELNLLIDGPDGVAAMESAFFADDWSRAVCDNANGGGSW